jgi:hypothetical protein
MIPGPPGPPGPPGKDGEDGEDAAMAILVSEKGGSGQFAQVLDFTQSLEGKSSGTLPRNISRVVLRYGEISGSTAIYGKTQTGDKLGAFGTVALILDDVIVHQYSLNRFQDCQILIPYSVAQTVEVFISVTASCKVAILDEGDRWTWVKVSDPDNLPEISTSQLN